MSGTKKQHILLVEADEFYADIYKKRLEKEGWTVRVVDDGADVFEAIKKKRPHLIILDILLPKLGGFDVIEQLREHANTEGIPVCILTDSGHREDIQKAEALEIPYFMKGQVNIETIIHNIHQLFNV